MTPREGDSKDDKVNTKREDQYRRWGIVAQLSHNHYVTTSVVWLSCLEIVTKATSECKSINDSFGHK